MVPEFLRGDVVKVKDLICQIVEQISDGIFEVEFVGPKESFKKTGNGIQDCEMYENAKYMSNDIKVSFVATSKEIQFLKRDTKVGLLKHTHTLVKS